MNKIAESSKWMMYAAARRVIRQLISMLAEVGCSYREIELALKLRPDDGKTVAEYMKKK